MDGCFDIGWTPRGSPQTTRSRRKPGFFGGSLVRCSTYRAIRRSLACRRDGCGCCRARLSLDARSDPNARTWEVYAGGGRSRNRIGCADQSGPIVAPSPPPCCSYHGRRRPWRGRWQLVTRDLFRSYLRGGPLPIGCRRYGPGTRERNGVPTFSSRDRWPARSPEAR
jgi:hypothetical protein